MSRVSVCAPLFNHEEHIVQCIESIAEQEVEKELIVVDDCSTDNSLEVLRDLLATDAVRSAFSRILVLENTVNMGAHYSLNRAAYNARYEWISFVNTDDYYKPGRLADLLSLSSPLCLSYIDYAFSDDVTQSERLEWRNRKVSAIEAFESGFPQSWPFLMWQHSFTTGNIFISRTLFEEIGGFSNLKYCHDWDFLLQAILRAEPVVSKYDSYVYRLHSGNTFRQLEDVAASDTEKCMRNYLLGEVRNPNAYHPSNLPERIFEQKLVPGPLHYFAERICQRESFDFRTINSRNIQRLKLLRA